MLDGGVPGQTQSHFIGAIIAAAHLAFSIRNGSIMIRKRSVGLVFAYCSSLQIPAFSYCNHVLCESPG